MESIPAKSDMQYQPSLTELCIDSGVGASQPNWHYIEDVDRLDFEIKAACSTQLKFIQEFRAHWASTEPHSLGIPQEWQPAKIPTEWNLQEWMQSAALMTWLRDVKDYLAWLVPSEVESRHNNLSSFAPDFLLRSPRCAIPRSENDSPLSLNPFYTLPFFMEVLTYPGDEGNAAFAIPGIFLITPGCNLVSKLELDFPPPLQGPETHLSEAFGLLMKPFVSFPNVDEMKANLLQPALLVGMKGPSPWPSRAMPSTALTSLDQKMRDLTQILQPNLAAHLLNWRLRCQQDVQAQFSLPLVSSSCLPPWFMLFGVLYDADGLVIVAHIPYRPAPSSTSIAHDQIAPYAYLSCIIDRIPMTGAARPTSPAANGESPIMSNFRVALALLALQRHAFMMSALWESVLWPTSITNLFQATHAHERSDTDESDESDGAGQELGDGDTGSDGRNQHDHDDNANSENEAQEKTNRCDEEYDGNDTHENDEDDKEGEVHSHGGHGTNEDVSEKDAPRSHSAGGAISNNPAGNTEHGSGDETSDDEDDDGFYDPVHGVIVHKEEQVGLLARVSQRERMQITIPEWLNKVSSQS